MSEPQRPLKVFLCHASQDKPAVRELYNRLKVEDWIDPWLDEEKLTYGQHWTSVIEEAIDVADAVIIFLSHNSVQKEGFVQRELNYAWDISLEKPRSVIFLIPFRLDSCEVPRHLRARQWGDYFGEKKDQTYQVLLRSLKERHAQKLRREEADRSSLEEERRERDAEERAHRGATERRMQEKTARDKAESDAAEKARLEAEEQARKKAEETREREVAEEAAREKEKHAAAEEAKREKAKRRADQVIALKGYIDQSFASLRLAISKAKPVLTIGGGLGFFFVLIWLGSLAIPTFLPAVPTPSSSATIAATSVPTRQQTATKAITSPPTNTKITTITRTPAPTAFPATITDAKGAQMVLVPAGDFLMGSNEKPWSVYDDDVSPVHTVELDAFYIDKYEVTNALYKACVDTGACTRPYNRSSNNRPQYYGNSEFDSYPVIYVDWYQAEAYCEWRGARLPTEAEWEKAAQGTDVYTSNNTGTTTYEGDTTEVGSYASQSVYGAYDMAGNVWEWVNDWYQKDYYSTLGDNAANPQGPSEGSSKVLRGGSWFPGGYAKGVLNESDLRTFNRYRDFPSRYYLDTGFRCARDVSP
jgi:formylglycine-generating enzyme required for sulfatase activity